MSYRAALRACPACRAPMREVHVEPSGESGVGIDVCDACGGAYVEFFDGEPSAVARALTPHVGIAGEQERGELVCPECKLEMRRAKYLERGPELARCDGCMALFAHRDELAELARFADEPPATTRGWIERVLRALLG